MRKEQKNSDGISEIVSEIIIVALLLVLAMVVYSLLFGSISGYLKPTSRVAATAGTLKVHLDPITTIQIPFAQTVAGEKYYLLGQSNISSGYAVASFILRDPSGGSHTVTPSILSAKANQYGTPLYLYQYHYQNNYQVTDSQSVIASSINDLIPLTSGIWTITMIDNTAHLPLTEMKFTIGSDSSQKNPDLPNYTLCLTGVCGSNGSGLTNNSFNITYGTGPGGMTTFHFNGIDSNASIPNNPDLTFTGDMTLSLWMKPDTSGSGTDNWHTVIGKGQILGGVENDNYQLVTIGNDLYFEWNDPSGQHYHVSTTGQNPLQNNQWRYVTVVVNGGTTGGVSIYNNGQLVPVQYYANNNPYPYEGTAMVTPPVVNLKANNLPTNIGIQADPSNPFYYKGDIGDLAVYNRALTTQEIQNNDLTYQA